MRKMVFSSVGVLSGGTYGDIEIDGVAQVQGDVTFEKMEIGGVCQGDGSLKGKELEVDGVCKVKGDIHVSTLEINGMMKTYDGHIYADQIEIDGVLNNSGEVNADHIMIDGACTLNELVGDVIEIDSAPSRGLFGLKTKFMNGKEANHIKLIECTKIMASGTSCGKMCAQEIELSNYCSVEEIECDGILKYDDTCRIGKISGTCEQIRE